MALPTTLKFGAGVLYFGDGASPEVFTKICGFTQLDLTIDKSTNDTTVPDCDDPDAPAWSEKDVVALSWSFSMSGVMAVGSLDKIDAATFSSAATSIRLDIAGAGTGSGTPVKRYAGKAHIKHSKSAQRGEKFQVKVDGEGDGELTKSNVAAS